MRRETRTLSGGQRQGVAIARAVHQGSRVLVMDEPMAALGLQEQGRVSELIEHLGERGLTQLIVSHNLDHVFQLSTHIAVMRLGAVVAVRPTADTDRREILHLISGVERMSTHEPLPAEVRQRRIRTYVSAREFVRVADISERFGISEVTARADLSALEERGHLRRVHGGAVPRGGHGAERPFDLADSSRVSDVAHLGAAAAARVERGDAILIDVGTTTTAMARAIVARSELEDVAVITNGLTIALELEAAFPRISVVVTGGTLRPMQHSLVNPLGEGTPVEHQRVGGIHRLQRRRRRRVASPTSTFPRPRSSDGWSPPLATASSWQAGSKVGVVELARVCDIRTSTS